jgi:hypothetical protein
VPAGSGWWALADEAVRAAGDVLLPAQQALGRARRLVQTVRRADSADEASWRAGPDGRVDAAADALAALRAAAADRRRELAELLDATAGGGLADRPRIALVDALSGSLLALSATCRRCAAPAAAVRPLAAGDPSTARTTSPGVRGSARPVRPRATGRDASSTGGSARATAAAGSRAAVAASPGQGSWTTTGPTPTVRPARATWPATAPATTAASTRRRGGGTSSARTAR